ncbi:MAG: glycosyltransferase family 2 protein [Bdellovibrionota bacterium]
MNRKISIIVPAYNEEASIEELHDKLLASFNVMKEKGQVLNYEIWFINDGSKDGTESKILSLIEKDKNVHLISFRKNFGKSPALDAGFRHAVGDIVFTLDADLQDEPSEMTRFVEKIDEGFDLVVGWKFNRLDPMEKKLPSKLFNYVTKKLSGVNLHDFDCGFKCFRKEVIESLDLYGELHRYIPVLAHREGFKITEITVEHKTRKHGKSKYGFERYLRGLFDSLTTTFLLRYNDRPMYLFGKLGILFSSIGFLICAYLTGVWCFTEQSIGNRPALLLGVLCLIMGLQFIATGFICNLLVDISHRENYTEHHIKKIV